VALVSIDHKAYIRGIINTNIDEIDFPKRHTMLEVAQEVWRLVTQYTEPTSTVQRVCDHRTKIILLQKEILDLKS
jgi:hypothetical protein